jgi:hypothetical protein
MSNFTQSAEPYYEYEHWYALGTLHGEPHHFLIFPRNVSGADSAIIVLLDAGATAMSSSIRMARFTVENN